MDNTIDFDAHPFAVSAVSDHGRTYVYDFREAGPFRDTTEILQWVDENYENADNFHWLNIVDRDLFDVDSYHNNFRKHSCCGRCDAAFSLRDGSVVVCSWNYGH